jgi:hypothetical protein
VGGDGQAVGVTAGGTCYAYRTTANDTPASVAAAFAAIIPAAIATGAVLTAPSITAVKTVADQSAFWRTGEKETSLQIAIVAVPFAGADGPLVRAALTRAVYGIESLARPDGSLTRFIGLPDGTTAQISGSDERDDDTVRRDNMWRRWVTLRVRYDVGRSQVLQSVLAPVVVGDMNGGRLIWIGNGAPAARVLTDGHGHILADGAGAPLGALDSIA